MSMGTVLTLRPAGSRMRPMRLTKRSETAWSSTFSWGSALVRRDSRPRASVRSGARR